MRVAVTLALAFSLSALAVPLPEVVLYGLVRVDQSTVPAAERAGVSAWVGGRRVARYTLGDLSAAGDSYFLSVPMGTVDEAGLAHVGDTVGFTVNGEETGVTVNLTEFGSAQFLPLALGGERVRAPVLEPPPGTQYGSTLVTVTMASATPNARILYTVDGSDPAPGRTATVYTGAVEVTADTDIRACAYDPASALMPSPVAGGVYLLRPADGDGDGLPDVWEQPIADIRPYDRINSPADVLPDDDFDGDGVTNAAEFAAGSDPTRDEASPTVLAARAAGQTDPASSEPIHFIVTFSESVTGFGDGAEDVVLSGTAGATTAVVEEAAPHDGTAYEIAVSGVTQAGSVVLSVSAGAAIDSAGNPCAASNQVQVAYLPLTYTLTYLAGANGSITGPTPQTVAPGGDSALVIATPATGYHFLQWSDGGLVAARTDTNVTANLTVTASFRAANPVAPDGRFLAVAATTDVLRGRGLWDLTGTYTTPVAGNPLVLNMVHDSTGRLIGTATYTVAPGTTVTMPTKGSVKGTHGIITMKSTLNSTDPTKAASVSLTLALTLDTVDRQLVGRLTGSTKANGTTTPMDEALTLAIPGGMDGTWTLRFDLGQAGRATTGTALLTLSNDVKRIFMVRGRTGANNTAVLSLQGDPADPAAKAITIRTTLTPLEGGWARLESFSGRGYGQTIGW